MTRRPPVLLDFVILIAVMQLLEYILELLRNRQTQMPRVFQHRYALIGAVEEQHRRAQRAAVADQVSIHDVPDADQYEDQHFLGDTAKAEEMMNQVEEMYKSIGVLQTDFIKNNPASYVTPYFLSAVQYEKEVEELDLLVQSLDPKLQEIPSVVKLKEHIAKLKVVAVGQIAPDFTMNDPEGNPVKFSDIYAQNEYTLLDFWASWCGPCRQENPNVVAVFLEFKEKGFGVFGVSLDRDRDAWLKAVQDDQLSWQHVSDLAYWQNAAAQLYAVNSIPSNLIVDRTGKIVAKNKRGDELRSTIAELLK
ncbi:MAG: TlpA family protein disulfide reductase [Bacteroidia bacterium]|nr:TlpA family protein disulfide reductase [Bacteroidia bacterium]